MPSHALRHYGPAMMRYSTWLALASSVVANGRALRASHRASHETSPRDDALRARVSPRRSATRPTARPPTLSTHASLATTPSAASSSCGPTAPSASARSTTSHAEAERRGAQLAARGLEKGDRLAIVIPDGDEFVLSFLGAIFAGIVPVPMYPQLSFKNVESYHDTVAHIARASGAKLLLTTTATRRSSSRSLARASRRSGDC